MNRIAVFFLVLLRQNGRSLRKRFNGVRFSYIHISPAAILSFCPSGWDLEGKSKQIFYATSASATTSSSRLLAKVGEETEHFD